MSKHDTKEEVTIDTSAIRFGEDISATLYSDIAENCAKEVSQAPSSKNRGSQLRRFYDELVMHHDKVGRDEKRYQQQAPFIQMLKAKVAYARGRDTVDVNYETLLRHVVGQIDSAAALTQAKLFMEAFMAYHKLHGKD